MYEWVEALGLEIQAAGRQGARRQPKLVDRYRSGIDQLAGTAAGQRTGEWVRKVGSFASAVPVLSWQADVLLGRHGIRALTAAVRDLPPLSAEAGVAAIRLAEAIDAVRRDRLALRSIGMLTSPVGAVVSTVALTAAEFGAGESAQRKLARRAYRIAGRAGTGPAPTGALRKGHPVEGELPFDDLHTMARACLAADKPRRALQFAYRAAAVARGRIAAAARTAPEEGGTSRLGALWRARSVGAVTESVRQAARESAARTYASLPEREAWERRCGAALVTAAWAHLSLLETDRAVQVARTAVALGNTMGHLVLAAAPAASGTSLRAREQQIEKIEDRDRREYCGVSRGDFATIGHLGLGQGRKVGDLVNGAVGKVRGRGKERSTPP